MGGQDQGRDAGDVRRGHGRPVEINVVVGTVRSSNAANGNVVDVRPVAGHRAITDQPEAQDEPAGSVETGGLEAGGQARELTGRCPCHAVNDRPACSPVAGALDQEAVDLELGVELHGPIDKTPRAALQADPTGGIHPRIRIVLVSGTSGVGRAEAAGRRGFVGARPRGPGLLPGDPLAEA
jgi:hypothetical protein